MSGAAEQVIKGGASDGRGMNSRAGGRHCPRAIHACLHACATTHKPHLLLARRRRRRNGLLVCGSNALIGCQLLRVRMRGLPFGDVPATFWDTALTEFNKGDNGVGGRRFGCPIPFTPTSVEPTAASESDEDEGNGFMDDSD